METHIKAFVDRLETTQKKQRIAVLVVEEAEGRLHTIEIPLTMLPEGTQEGDHFLITLTPDPASRQALKGEIEDLMQELLESSEGR